MFDGAQQIARNIPARGAHFRAADPQRAAIEAKPIEAPRPAKQRGIAVAANVGENPRSDALGSRVVRTAPGEEFRGHRIG